MKGSKAAKRPGKMDIKRAIREVVAGKDLTEAEMASVFDVIMTGKATPAQIAGFLTALRLKGETADEITGAARIMRKRALKLKVSCAPGEKLVDTCGTGGSGLSTFNFSTASAFITAGCGVKVAKHGNRSASGKCGSADVLEELGIKLDVSARVVERCINEIGIGFIYAPVFHSSMKHAIGPRKEIGIRTIFNLLGPLCNPAFPARQVIALYDGTLTVTIARVLKNLGLEKAYVVHGSDGLDEVTITGKTRVSELNAGKIRTYDVDPFDFGLRKYSAGKITGGGPERNARIMRTLLSGKKGAIRDMAVMNSAMALLAANAAKSLKEGVRMSQDSIDSGRAMEKLELLRRVTSDRRGCSGARIKKRVR